VFYSLALVIAVLLFPLPVAAAVVLGTSITDPLAGELRRRTSSLVVTAAVPFVAYELLAVAGLAVIGHWPLATSAGLAAVAAAIAVLVERPKRPWWDDDLVMMLVPALFLYGVGVALLGLPA